MRQRIASRLYGQPISLWVVGLVTAAVVATVLMAVAAQIYVMRVESTSQADQRERFREATTRVETYMGDARALARVVAATVGRVRDDRRLADAMVMNLMRSRRNESILGVGFYFAPGVFDRSGRTFAPYASLDGTGQIGLTDDSGPRGSWVVYARQYPNRVTFLGPYPALQKRGTSALLALYEGQRFIGMASVDTMPSTLVLAMQHGLQDGDVAYISDRDGIPIVKTGDIPQGPDFPVITGTLKHGKAQLHLVSSLRGVQRAQRTAVVSAIAAIAGMWVIVLLLSFAIVRAEHHRRKSMELEAEQQRLQDEIATRIEVEKRLREAAYVDQLTTLPNRGFFLDRLSLLLSVPSTAHEYGVLHVDIDRFNLVNDTHGHPMGDELLRRVGMRLLDALPAEAVVARLGGDEFAVLVHGGARAALHSAEHVVELLRLPVLLRDRDIYLTASVGVVLLDSTYREPQDILRDADIAMYEAKARGRNTFATFDTLMRRRIERELQLGHDLRRAIEQSSFVPHYQTIVELASGDIGSLEALARWIREGEVIGAAAFIPHAEQQGLVGEIDERVFARVCAEIEAGLIADTVAINISAAHLTEPHLVPRIRAMLERHRIDAGRIKLEVTETAIMTNAQRALNSLQQLRDLGIEIVVDDFGTGHSSLAYLQRLPISGVKIDRSFISSIEHDQQAVEIVRSIVALAGAVRLYTVAEGIENESQLRILRELGVKYGQGFFFSQPVPADQLGRSSQAGGAAS